MGRVVVPSIVASVLLLAGCGDDGNDRATSTTTTSTSPTVSAARTSSSPSAEVPPSTASSNLAGEDLTADQAAQLQQSVDAGHQPWRLDEVCRPGVRGRPAR